MVALDGSVCPTSTPRVARTIGKRPKLLPQSKTRPTGRDLAWRIDGTADAAKRGSRGEGPGDELEA